MTVRQTATITFQCVYDRKHKKTVNANGPGTLEMPLCDIDGGPMIAIQAKVKR
jgi:hypothetical protein